MKFFIFTLLIGMKLAMDLKKLSLALKKIETSEIEKIFKNFEDYLKKNSDNFKHLKVTFHIGNKVGYCEKGKKKTSINNLNYAGGHIENLFKTEDSYPKKCKSCLSNDDMLNFNDIISQIIENFFNCLPKLSQMFSKEAEVLEDIKNNGLYKEKKDEIENKISILQMKAENYSNIYNGNRDGLSEKLFNIDKREWLDDRCSINYFKKEKEANKSSGFAFIIVGLGPFVSYRSQIKTILDNHIKTELENLAKLKPNKNNEESRILAELEIQKRLILV